MSKFVRDCEKEGERQRYKDFTEFQHTFAF